MTGVRKMARVVARNRASAPEPTVERKIYFYEIDAGQKNGEPVEFGQSLFGIRPVKKA